MNIDNIINQIAEILITYAPKVVGAILTLIIGFWVIKWLTKRVKKIMIKREFDESLQPFLLTLFSIGLKILLIISIAGMFGIQTASFVAVLGAMAFAIGMALQGSLGHFASGILILVNKPYEVDDVVELAGHTGQVISIQIFNTILHTFDNQRIVIPNGIITSNPIRNINALPERRVDLTFGIDYSNDIDKARSVIQGVADNCEQILDDPPVVIQVNELADSSVNFKVKAWVITEDYWTVYHYMTEQVKKAFDREGVSMPFPQMDVHLQKEPA